MVAHSRKVFLIFCAVLTSILSRLLAITHFCHRAAVQKMFHVCASQDSAQFGEHIWFETSGSGDFCYVGEQYCFAKSLVSHSAPCGHTGWCVCSQDLMK